ncbi:MAG: hypothetical protein GY760_14155 [Deltaproteobacteria bacterium]|nr:hypothetical protein [Deltaproteobacteria bacterium]
MKLPEKGIEHKKTTIAQVIDLLPFLLKPSQANLAIKKLKRTATKEQL